jgi:hypothetical protein
LNNLTFLALEQAPWDLAENCLRKTARAGTNQRQGASSDSQNEICNADYDVASAEIELALAINSHRQEFLVVRDTIQKARATLPEGRD